MTLPSFLGRLSASVLVLFLLLLSACGTGGTPLDAQVPGSCALSGDEFSARYSGNSIRLARSSKGAINREMYFAADGSLQIIDLDRDVILAGTWAGSPGH